MLNNKSSSAIVAVGNLDRARRFYEGTLGLAPGGDSQQGVVEYRTGDTTLTVYQSENARPGTGNAVAWSGGGDVEAIADELRRKGVALEEYPDLGMQVERGIHRADGFAAIWFKDPDGNILHVNSM